MRQGDAGVVWPGAMDAPTAAAVHCYLTASWRHKREDTHSCARAFSRCWPHKHSNTLPQTPSHCATKATHPLTGVGAVVVGLSSTPPLPALTRTSCRRCWCCCVQLPVVVVKDVGQDT